MIDLKNLTRDLIALLIVIGSLATLFLQVDPVGAGFIRFAGGVVIGFYFGVKEIPTFGYAKKN